MTQGDPRLILSADGSRLQFNGGQPILDRGFENLALISLFTSPGWCGNQLLDEAIGSDFEQKCNQPITRASINQIRNSAERALANQSFGPVVVTVNNPQGYRLEINILIQRSNTSINLTRDGGAWYYQTTDPAYRKI